MSEKRGLEQLQVWRRAMDLAVIVCHQVLPRFPSEEQYALTAQLRRAVQSIHANIAEAHGRYHYTDVIRFLYIARGSLDETRSHLILALELGYLPEELYRDLYSLLNEVGRKLNGYIRYQAQRRSHDKGQLREESRAYQASDTGIQPMFDLIPNPEPRFKIDFPGVHSPLNKDLS
jgi:four helix bundle protein